MSESPKAVTEDPPGLSEEQVEFLKSLEEEFKDRFTENDQDYKCTLESDNPPPPLLLDWDKINKPNNYYRGRRHFDRFDRRYGKRDDRHDGGGMYGRYDDERYDNRGKYRRYDDWNDGARDRYRGHRPWKGYGNSC